MIDINKLQRKGELAKEMIRLGVSTDIESALKDIEKHNLAGREEEFKVGKQDTPAQSEIKRTQIVLEGSKETKKDPENIDNKRLDDIEKKLAILVEFVNKYKEQNDKNLKELDNGLKSIYNQLRQVEADKKIITNAPTQQSLKIEPQAEKKSEAPKKKDDLSPSDFAVEKIFNNANNQMMNKGK